jgi:hypothetical protein
VISCSKVVRFAVLGLAFCPLPAAHSQSPSGPRSYYGDWMRHSSGYYYRPYYFRPYSGHQGYRHHDMVHYGDHYYYNPIRRRSGDAVQQIPRSNGHITNSRAISRLRSQTRAM